MEWSNDKIIEFLETLRTEPTLWDLRRKSYKSRSVHGEAWHRIVQALSFATTVEDLKKKKESLMGYYRIHLNKYKKSLKLDAESTDVYTTNWFAFDIMHSFLEPIYIGDATHTTEESSHAHFSPAHKSASDDSDSLTPPQSSRPSKIRAGYNRPAARRFQTKRPEEHYHLQSVSSEKGTRKYDEYDHFALMIAAKIRKINNYEERETVMNAIHNLVFQSMMKTKKFKT